KQMIPPQPQKQPGQSQEEFEERLGFYRRTYGPALRQQQRQEKPTAPSKVSRAKSRASLMPIMPPQKM
ncbi:MAG: hypothetical protein ACK5PF_01925, partial [bacterium]